MIENFYIPLPHRTVIAISGSEKNDFLQGIITNDITKVSKEQSILALMLTPQGKFLYDFFISLKEDKLLIDCATKHKDMILKKFRMYKLRRDVVIEDLSDTYEVVALCGSLIDEKVESDNLGATLQFCKGLAFKETRKNAPLGMCVIEKENKYNSLIVHDFIEANLKKYESARIKHLIPSGDFDMTSEESFPLDFQMDEFNAIDYKKGCYVGQEVTARVHYKGKKRKKLYQVQATNGKQLPNKGEDILSSLGKKVGIMCSKQNDIGLAVLKTDDLDNVKFEDLILL